MVGLTCGINAGSTFCGAQPAPRGPNCTWYVIMDLKITPSGQTIVKPTALGPVANTDTKLLIYGLFQKGRVLAQDGVDGFDESELYEPPDEEPDGSEY